MQHFEIWHQSNAQGFFALVKLLLSLFYQLITTILGFYVQFKLIKIFQLLSIYLDGLISHKLEIYY